MKLSLNTIVMPSDSTAKWNKLSKLETALEKYLYANCNIKSRRVAKLPIQQAASDFEVSPDSIRRAMRSLIDEELFYPSDLNMCGNGLIDGSLRSVNKKHPTQKKATPQKDDRYKTANRYIEEYGGNRPNNTKHISEVT